MGMSLLIITEATSLPYIQRRGVFNDLWLSNIIKLKSKKVGTWVRVPDKFLAIFYIEGQNQPVDFSILSNHCFHAYFQALLLFSCKIVGIIAFLKSNRKNVVKRLACETCSVEIKYVYHAEARFSPEPSHFHFQMSFQFWERLKIAVIWIFTTNNNWSLYPCDLKWSCLVFLRVKTTPAH